MKQYSFLQENKLEEHHFYVINSDCDIVSDCKNPIGKIGLSIYKDIKAIGIGSFEIFKKYRRHGYAEKTLRKLIDNYRNKFNLIYCYVDKDNKPAINLYNKIGEVSKKLNKNNQYIVILYRKT